MLPLAADENLNNDIVRGLLRRRPHLDIVRVQDAELSGLDDPAVLEWAANEDRLLLTHDVTTMTRYANDRIRKGKSVPGIIEIGNSVPVRVAIEDILLISENSLEGEWEGQILYLPLR
jgi:predicted nuclease of predicted toxin-antitoxin system